MQKKRIQRPFDPKRALLSAYDVSERMNQYLLEHLDDRAWRAKPPGGKVRNIAQVVTHIHNVRRLWLGVCGKDVRGLKVPTKLDRARCTKKQAMAALAKSAQSMSRFLAEMLECPDGRVKNFPSRAVGFATYHISHEAHHRGQVIMLARQAGCPISQETDYGLWALGRRRTE